MPQVAHKIAGVCARGLILHSSCHRYSDRESDGHGDAAVHSGTEAAHEHDVAAEGGQGDGHHPAAGAHHLHERPHRVRCPAWHLRCGAPACPQSSFQTVKSGGTSPGLFRAAACCDAVTSALRWPDSARRYHASDARKLVPAQPSVRCERHHGSAAADCCHDVRAQAGSASAPISESLWCQTPRCCLWMSPPLASTPSPPMRYAHTPGTAECTEALHRFARAKHLGCVIEVCTS